MERKGEKETDTSNHDQRVITSFSRYEQQEMIQSYL